MTVENAKKMNISFSPPDITELEIQYVADALRSGWITTGPRTKKLEQLIAQRLGVDKCVCLNSQTMCAELSLRLLGIGPGDEVITCAYTYTASASVIDHVGAKIVLVDCQKDNLEMDYDAMERAINERTKAVIPVDVGGIPCDYDRIIAAVERKKELFRPANDLQRAIGRVAIIEDAAHAFGAVWHGKPVGCISDITTFSFHAVKNFTVAEGGAITWRPMPGIADEAVYKRLQLYSLHGQDKDALAKTKMGSWEYDIVGPWYKCNMTDIAAAIGLAQLERYPGLLERRREIIGRYDGAFRPLGVETLAHYTDQYSSSGHLYITRVPGITPDQRNEIIVRMAELGVACNVHYKPLPMHTAYKKMGFDIADYPNSYARFANEITLPLHTCLTDEQVEYVIACYCQVLKDYLK
jgi:dTDP-4-amino-4,6-dideoxygalactose transaminase